MSCLQVREKLAEHAMGTLRGADGQEVERHLEWCAGCRKEAAEFQEGAAVIGLALPEEEPPSHLERQIVERIAAAAGHRKPRARRGIWALAAATLAAMLVAVSAFSWAVAERQKALSAEQIAAQQASRLRSVQREFDGVLASFAGRGAQLQSELIPAVGTGGLGRATIVADPKADDFIFLSMVPPTLSFAPYTYELSSADGARLVGGNLLENQDTGVWSAWEYTGQDLSSAATVTVRDRLSRPVLLGPVGPYTTPAPPG